MLTLPASAPLRHGAVHVHVTRVGINVDPPDADISGIGRLVNHADDARRKHRMAAPYCSGNRLNSTEMNRCSSSSRSNPAGGDIGCNQEPKCRQVGNALIQKVLSACMGVGVTKPRSLIASNSAGIRPSWSKVVMDSSLCLSPSIAPPCQGTDRGKARSGTGMVFSAFLEEAPVIFANLGNTG